MASSSPHSLPVRLLSLERPRPWPRPTAFAEGPCPPTPLASWISGDAETGAPLPAGTRERFSPWKGKRWRDRVSQGWQQSWGARGLLGGRGESVERWERKESEEVARMMNWALLASSRGTRKEWNFVLISFWRSICESLNGTRRSWADHVGTDFNRSHQLRGKPRGEAAT